MEDTYNSALNRQVSGMWRSLRDGDFEEEDVWDVLRDRKEYPISNYESSSVSIQRSLAITAAKVIPRSGVSNEVKNTVFQQQSLPVNIPDWSKMNNNKRNKSKLNHFEREEDDNYDYDHDHDHDDGCDSDDDKIFEMDYYYNRVVPPHEIIARRLARSQISSFSVFEGAGRTLKGRDLSKVRNAVLNKTGFLESL